MARHHVCVRCMIMHKQLVLHAGHKPELGGRSGPRGAFAHGGYAHADRAGRDGALAAGSYHAGCSTARPPPYQPKFPQPPYLAALEENIGHGGLTGAACITCRHNNIFGRLRFPVISFAVRMTGLDLPKGFLIFIVACVQWSRGLEQYPLSCWPGVRPLLVCYIVHACSLNTMQPNFL